MLHNFKLISYGQIYVLFPEFGCLIIAKKGSPFVKLLDQPHGYIMYVSSMGSIHLSICFSAGFASTVLTICLTVLLFPRDVGYSCYLPFPWCVFLT